MPFDSLTMAAVTDEVRTRVVGGRIQKIIQPSSEAVALSVYKDGTQRWLLLSADARFARVSVFDERLAKAFPTPSAFVMLLRKYLEGVRLQDVSQMPRERIMVFGAPGARLVAEVMGKHSNVMLVSEEDRVLGAVKNVPPRESRVRPILPGRVYVPPPTRERNEALFPPGPLVDPYEEPDLFAALLRETEPSVRLRTALLGLLAGCGPFLADQIARRSGLDADVTLSEASVARLLEAAQAVYKLYHTRDWEPVTFLDARGRIDLAPYVPLGMENVEHASSISVAVERTVGGAESRDSLGTSRKIVLDRIERALRAAERRAESLRTGLAASEGAEEVMQAGQLILAYQYLLEPGASELTIPEMQTVIPLDPRRSPAENAERRFKRYRKLRDAGKRIPLLLARAESEAERLRDLSSFVTLAENETDLRTIEREISPDQAAEKPQEERREKRRGPRRYTTDGYTAIVGRSARENEEVTFRLAGRNDLWLHARERTGAHVILQGPKDPPQELVHAAAELAAYFSEGRKDTRVEVIIASVRDVRKSSGGPPGRVTYRNSRTIRVEPSMAGWQPL